MEIESCYASYECIYYLLKIFSNLLYPGAAREINLEITSFKTPSTMVAQGFSLYNNVVYNIIWILEIIQYTQWAPPVCIRLPLDISAAEGASSLLSVYVCILADAHKKYSRVCSCVSRCGMFPRDKTAMLGPLQPSPQASSD